MFLAKRYALWVPFFMPDPVTTERTWRDPIALKIIKDPEYVKTGIDIDGEPFRLGTGANLVRALEAVRHVIPSLKAPFLTIHGTKEFAVPIAGSELLHEKAATAENDKKCVPIQDAFHELLADFKPDDVMRENMGWIHERL